MRKEYDLGHGFTMRTDGSPDADEFAARILSGRQSAERLCALFTEFCLRNDWRGWHIHDGWVRVGHDGYQNGSAVNLDRLDRINIGWIESHAGYSHTSYMPKKGEKMVVIKNSPGSAFNDNPFTVYIYHVVEVESRWGGQSITLKLTYLDRMKVSLSRDRTKYQKH